MGMICDRIRRPKGRREACQRAARGPSTDVNGDQDDFLANQLWTGHNALMGVAQHGETPCSSRGSDETYAEIAHECGCDWRTVRKHLTGDAPSVPPAAPPRVGTQPKVIAPFVGVIEAWLRRDHVEGVGDP